LENILKQLRYIKLNYIFVLFEKRWLAFWSNPGNRS